MLVSPAGRAVIVLVLAAFGCGRPNLDPYRAHVQGPVTGVLAATFLGTASVLFTDGTNGILTDPFVTRPRVGALAHPIGPDEVLVAQTLTQLGTPKIDAIATGHSHYDHAMDAAVFAQRTGAVLLGSYSTMNIGLGAKKPLPRMEEVHEKEVRTYGHFRITFIKSTHSDPDVSDGHITKVLKPPAFVRTWKTGTTWSMLIQHRQRSLLVHGSANFQSGALRDTRADVVYLGIGGLGKKDDAFVEQYWQEVVRATKARRVILVHWDDFFRPLSEPLRPMVGPLDSFPDSMRRLLQCGATDGVEVLLPVAWQATDPFAGLRLPPERTATAPHPCRAQ